MKLNKRAVAFGLLWAVVLGGLYLTTLFSYLLFHTLAEVFSSAVGVAIFMLIWNVRRSLDNNYLLFLGVAYLFIGGLDLVHSLSYKGMGVFTGYDENLPTQLWIGVRYLQSISLLVAPLFLGKRLSLRYVVAAYFLASSFIVGAVFYWDIFPACFVPGQGLTTFKKVSEYVIAGILIASIALLLKKRDQLDPTVFRLLVVSISLTIASEWCFTMYADVYGFFNLIGHFLKVLAFYCIYKAIIELGMAKPFAVLFRNLKESEEALRRERDFIAAVLSTAGALVIVLDREGRIVRFNRACEQLTGYSFGEVRGRFFWDLFLIPEEVEPVKKVFEQLRLGNFPYDNENHWVAKDGNRRMIRWANTALPGHSGVIEFVIGIGIDITERKKAEEALKKAHDVLEQRVEERTAHLVKACEKLTRQILERRRAEESLELEKIKLRSILDSMADGVYMANQQGLIEYANPALEKEFGSAVGRRCYEYLEGRNEQCPWCKNGEIFYGKSNQYEWYSKKTGKTYEIFDTPVLNVDGTTARLEILHDITARKKAEAAVRESEMKYRIVADYTYDWEWWRGSDGKFIYVSPSCKDITSHGVEEFMSDPDLFFRIVHPEDQPSFQGHVAGIEDKDLSGEFEFRIIRPDGSFRWIAHGCRPVFDEQGMFKGRRGSNRDITERKKAEESTLIALSEIKILKERLEAENIYFQKEIKGQNQSEDIIGQSSAIKYVLYRVEQVAQTSTTVLVLGETGTGKDLIAAAIHRMSPRRDRPLVTINCAALPANLIESELFGREKGAFTGADTRQTGRFEIADGSTLCLDEIGELPLDLQAKLLRVIQHSQFERLGSSRTIHVDVRIVATTNRNLEEEVRKGTFRQDLYYRLNVFPITVPPLRQRKEDIPLLVEAFVSHYARQHRKGFTSIQAETMKALQEYDWPGNIRELKNVIERAVILCPGPVLKLAEKLDKPDGSAGSPIRTLEETEKDQIYKTLIHTQWRINGANGAAAILGLHPSTLRARMQKLGIRRPDVRIKE